VRIEVCPIVRDVEGVALSSRNVYLRGPERVRARALSRALRAAQEAVDAGERDPSSIIELARTPLSTAGLEPDYLELVSPETLAPLERIDGDALVVVAARVGPVRLIDNHLLCARSPGEQREREALTCNA
jgi:pantoate--beta-alanine ligase